MDDFKASRLGDLMVEQGLVSSRELAEAVRLQRRDPALKLGEALVQLNCVTMGDVDAFLQKQLEMRAGGNRDSERSVKEHLAAYRAQTQRLKDTTVQALDTVASDRIA